MATWDAEPKRVSCSKFTSQLTDGGRVTSQWTQIWVRSISSTTPRPPTRFFTVCVSCRRRKTMRTWIQRRDAERVAACVGGHRRGPQEESDPDLIWQRPSSLVSSSENCNSDCGGSLPSRLWLYTQPASPLTPLYSAPVLGQESLSFVSWSSSVPQRSSASRARCPPGRIGPIWWAIRCCLRLEKSP